jgi:O-acetyl-ADP-ribose deacetylase (regulator of RNase III)
MSHISLQRASITTVSADAIVNAANESLEGGGGVDFAVHSAAGINLYNECCKFPIKKLYKSLHADFGRCDVGEVAVTAPYNLENNCKYIFHTVAPIFDINKQPNIEHLKLCYKSCLDKAVSMNLKSIAFCCLGTGFYKFPKDIAAQIAVDIAKSYVNIDIIFTVVDEIDYQLYTNLLN